MPKKKTFKANPALQFITAHDEPTEPDSGKLSRTEETEPTAKRPQPPEGYRLAPQFIEKRTRRVQLVLQPSVYDKIKATAQAENKSLNDYIHFLLEEDIARKEGTHK